MSAIRGQATSAGHPAPRRGCGDVIRTSDLDGREVGAAPRRVDALDLDDDGVAEPQRHARLRADEHRLLLVELPPIAAQAPHREQTLVAVAERDEGARADHADHLTAPL